MVKLINIEKFFLKNSCCNGEIPSCRISPYDDPIEYFKHYYKRNVELHAVTITIGNKKYGSMSNDEQYKHIVKAIKGAYKYHGTEKYIFYFEQQNNGNLHAHGVLMNAYQGKFIDNFLQFGQRNTHDASYQKLRNLGYFGYIQKEKNKIKYKFIHNIKKIDFIQMKQEKVQSATQAPTPAGLGDGDDPGEAQDRQGPSPSYSFR